MLNLDNPIVFTPDEQSVIASVMADKNKGGDRWSDGRTKAIKHKISETCLREQKCYCAYCEGLVSDGDAPIEHISPKGLTPEFVFEPLNLVVSCTRCNSTAIKGEKPTINGSVNPIYMNNTFLIVHPRLDNPDNEIVFQDPERTMFDKERCSPKGLYTIDFFQWDNETAWRNRVAAAETRKHPFDIERLIYESSTYKSRHVTKNYD